MKVIGCSLMSEDDVDPRAVLPCPLGLKKEGREHDPKTADNYFWQCACGAWQKGTVIMFPKGTFSGVDQDRKMLVSDRQLQKLIDGGLHIDPKIREAVRRRLSGAS
jgi:hypothetical protein